MYLIAHRGNVNGPNPDRENTVPYLQEALDAGYNIEVDVWLVNTATPGSLDENTLFLGHDHPLHEVGLSFFRDSRVWAHCKTPETYQFLSKFPDVNCFEHNNEPWVITSQGYAWFHRDHSKWYNKVTPKSGIFLDPCDYGDRQVLGICGDYIGKFPVNIKMRFDLLVIDIDGVMTDGKIYDRDGKVVGKSFCDLDFTAIKRFKSAGVKVCFLSGDKWNASMAESRKVDFHNNVPGIDKVEFIPKLEEVYGTTRSRIAYIGDDYYDIGIMSHVGLSFCPASSPAIVKRAATTVLPVSAGKGVIASLYDFVENEFPNVYPIDSPEVNP